MQKVPSFVLLLPILACSSKTGSPPTMPSGDHFSDQTRAMLTLPPGRETAGALNSLHEAHRRGSCEAARIRSLYLLDLFDAVRLLPGTIELKFLWKALDLPGAPSRGRAATRRALKILEQLFVDLPPGCTREAWARDAVSLLNTDRRSRTSTDEALEVAVAYKQIARSSSHLSPNALLRLTDWCTKAFKLAAGGDPAQQHLHLSQCLFPLFDADPIPYFQEDAARRPSDPPWPLLREALVRAQDQLSRTRLAPVVKQLVQSDQRFFEMAGAVLPTPLNLAALTPPMSNAGIPWDRTPIVAISSRGYLVGGRAVLNEDSDELVEAIAKRLKNDRRGRVTVVARPSCSAQRILTVARAACRAGCRLLDLGVVRQVAERSPAGDVQARVFGKSPVLALEGIPLFLGLLCTRGARPPLRDRPKGASYDPMTARGELAMVINRAHLLVSSKDGALPPIGHQDLVTKLRALRRAYPADRSMVLVPDSSASNAEMVQVAALLMQQGQEPLFPGLALSTPTQIHPPDKDLTPLLHLLANASVKIDPLPGQSWPALIRRCFVRALKKSVQSQRSPPEGTLLVRADRKRVRIVGGTLRSRDLRRCVIRTIGEQKLAAPKKIMITLGLGDSGKPLLHGRKQ